MLHRVYGRKFSRPLSQQQSLFKNLTKDFIIHGKLTTTKQKAKAIQGPLDHLVAQVRKNKITASREIHKIVGDKKIVAKLVGEIAPLFGDRTSGFTRIIPLGPRSDTAQMVRLEWVVEIPTIAPKLTKQAEAEKTIQKPKAETKTPRTSPARRPTPKMVKPVRQAKKFQTPTSAMKPSNSK